MFALARQVQALYRSFEDSHATGPDCIPTARNTKCYQGPLPGDDALYGAYRPDSRPNTTEPPVGGDYVYWEHTQCTLDMAGGTCY